MLQILFLNGRYVFLLSGVKSSLMLNKTKQKTSKYRILHQRIGGHLACTLGWQPRKASWKNEKEEIEVVVRERVGRGNMEA